MSEWRGTPRFWRTLAAPAGSLAAAALGGALVWAVPASDPRLELAVVSAAIFGVYQLLRAQRLLLRQRRSADDWLRSATGAFVPQSYAWRAAQLCSPRQRQILARTLRLVEQSAGARLAGTPHRLRLPAVQVHRRAVRRLARALENLDEQVTPAGMLRVIDLVTGAGSPLWRGTSDAALGDAISATFAILTPCVSR
jgi:hypothetical protein